MEALWRGSFLKINSPIPTPQSICNDHESPKWYAHEGDGWRYHDILAHIFEGQLCDNFYFELHQLHINFISTSYEYFIQQQPSTISTSPALVFLSSFLPVQVLIILLTISHFTGCLWFAVGARNTSESTWVKVLGYDSQGVDAQYLAALHWALSQFLGEPIQ